MEALKAKTAKDAKEAAKVAVGNIAAKELESSEKQIKSSSFSPDTKAGIKKQVYNAVQEERTRAEAEREKVTEDRVAAEAMRTVTNEKAFEAMEAMEELVKREAAREVTAVAEAKTSGEWARAFKSLEDKAINIASIHATDETKAWIEASRVTVADIEAKLPPDVVPPAKDVAQKMVEATTAEARWRLMSNEPSGTMMRSERAAAIKAVVHLGLLEWWMGEELRWAEILLKRMAVAAEKGWNPKDWK
jgi:hypothetical protein